MPLIKYAQYLFYPDGSPASEVELPVHLWGGNVLVPTFTNKAGTTPLANPVMTDVGGLLTFYAAPGNYLTDVAGTIFNYPVDAGETDDAWPGLFIHAQASAAATWTVAHHFGVEPSVNVIVEGDVVEAGISHTDGETTVITFGAPSTGTAYLRR